jgi:hypothetical protein
MTQIEGEQDFGRTQGLISVTELAVPFWRRCTSVHTFSGNGIWIDFISQRERAVKPSNTLKNECFLF